MGKTGDGNVPSDYDFVKNVLRHLARNDEICRADYERLRQKGSIELVARVLTNPSYLVMAFVAVGTLAMYLVPMLLHAFAPELEEAKLLILRPQTPEQGLLALIFYGLFAISVLLLNQASLYGLHLRKGTRAPFFGSTLKVSVPKQERGEVAQKENEGNRLSRGSGIWSAVVYAIYLLSLIGFLLPGMEEKPIWLVELMASVAAGVHAWSRRKRDGVFGGSFGLIALAFVIPVPLCVISLFAPSICLSWLQGHQLLGALLSLGVVFSLYYNLVYLAVSALWIVDAWLSMCREAKQISNEADTVPDVIEVDERGFRVGKRGGGEVRRSLRGWILNDLMPIAAVFGSVFIACAVLPTFREIIDPAPVSPTVVSATMEISAREANDAVAEWGDGVHVGNGDIVEFQVRFENSSDTELRNARLTAVLPDELEYVRGTARVCTPKDATGQACDGLFANKKDQQGADIGDYEPGEYAYVRFKAVVTNKADPGCHTVYVCAPDGAPDVADAKDVSVYVSSSDG